MTKGIKGESCAEAIRQCLLDTSPVPASEFHRRLKEQGSWSDRTIQLHLMALVVNLPPARQHWSRMKPFLFLRPDGQYETYDARRHPQVIE